jgi:hypothetical protein
LPIPCGIPERAHACDICPFFRPSPEVGLLNNHQSVHGSFGADPRTAVEADKSALNGPGISMIAKTFFLM